MPVSSPVHEYSGQLPGAQTGAASSAGDAAISERVRAMEAELESDAGPRLREQMARYVIQFLPVEHLVPDLYAQWRPLVQDAMLFFATHLSTARLAPKLVEQIDLALNTPPEMRLLRLIAKVPGLQKLGQVLARNRHLHPSLRKALTELENGICDVDIDKIRAIIHSELGQKLATCAVEIEPAIFFEASVSAVVRFTWFNPEIERRERGVFKVMKPYIPACFAEDMHLLAELAKHLGSKHRKYGFAKRVLPDTFRDVRRLLQHEVQFLREQKTLPEAHRVYGSIPGVRVPRLIRPLCTAKITAITEESGKKITDAAVRMSAARRRRVSEQLIDSLLAVPLFSVEENVMFHADPHAGNLLYDQRTGDLVILDWALTGHLNRAQRRHLALLFLMLILRDPLGVSYAIQALSCATGARRKQQAKIIQDNVAAFIGKLPIKRVPRVVDAMDLLETIAWEGVRLPAPLVMLRKVLFTLDGILHDIRGPDLSIEFLMASHVAKSWMSNWKKIGSPLSFTDWILLQCSALLYGSRLSLQWAQSLDSTLPAGAVSMGG